MCGEVVRKQQQECITIALDTRVVLLNLCNGTETPGPTPGYNADAHTCSLLYFKEKVSTAGMLWLCCVPSADLLSSLVSSLASAVEACFKSGFRDAVQRVWL